jgi:hypothetical protein
MMSREHTQELQTYFRRLSNPYRCRKSVLSYGIWNESLQAVEILQQHRSGAKFFDFMGQMQQSKLYLQPEEALFMMQCSLLQVVLERQSTMPIGLDEAYFLWFNRSSFPLVYAHVYQYLTRIGFILVRHQTTTATTRLIERQQNDRQLTTASINKRKRDDADDDNNAANRWSIENDRSSIFPDDRVRYFTFNTHMVLYRMKSMFE